MSNELKEKNEEEMFVQNDLQEEFEKTAKKMEESNETRREIDPSIGKGFCAILGLTEGFFPMAQKTIGQKTYYLGVFTGK